VVMFISLAVLRELNIFILIVISAFIYLSVIYITRAIDKEDMEIIRKIRG
jgi:hypothetical protein